MAKAAKKSVKGMKAEDEMPVKDAKKGGKVMGKGKKSKSKKK